jgi:hypothetical protein
MKIINSKTSSIDFYSWMLNIVQSIYWANDSSMEKARARIYDFELSNHSDNHKQLQIREKQIINSFPIELITIQLCH